MKVLFVDDEMDILNSIRRQLRRENYDVITVTSGNEALELLSKETFSLIVSDERMPGKSGVELLKEIKKKYPDTLRIILSGYADSKTIIDAINKGEIYRFIPKPWDIEELKETINHALEKWNIEQSNKIHLKNILEENTRLKEELSYRESKLQLNKESLDQLQVPVLLIGKEFTIEGYNDLFLQNIDNNIKLGINILEYLSVNNRGEIEKLLRSESLINKLSLKIKKRSFSIVGRGFRPSDDYLGILIFEVD